MVGKADNAFSLVRWLRSALILVALRLSLGFWSCALSSPLPQATPPNIVLIFIDDQGYTDLGCYGAVGFETPNIDRLAQQGVRFTDFYVSHAVCSASRASLLTGCYAERVSIQGALNSWAQSGLNPEEETIAEVLKEQGYATGIVGKWHLGHLPEFLPPRQGFDEYFGLPYSNDMWPLGYDGLPAQEGWKQFYPQLPVIEGDSIVGAVRTMDDQATLTTRYTEKAVEFINRHREHPFFLYIAHSMVHVPLGVSEKFRGRSEQGKYGDVMMEVDWSVGQIVGALKENGLEENTLIIYTSDNGPWLSMGNHGGAATPLREGKGTAFEGGVRVPCIMRWPGHIGEGRVVGRIASTIDILPTICAITGAALPRKPIDGVSLLPILQGDTGVVPRNEFYYYFDAELRAVRRGDWKLLFPHRSQSYGIFPPGKDGIPGRIGMMDVGLELYNLSSDAGERNDVAVRHPGIVDSLTQLAEMARKELGDRLTGEEGTGVRPAGRRLIAREPTRHLAVGATLRFAHPPHRRYTGGGETALVDSQHGSLDYTDGRWQGYEGVDLDVIIDLQGDRRVNEVKCGFLEGQFSWIFLPREVAVSLSDDGKRFRRVWSTTIDAPRANPVPNVREIAASFAPADTRFVRVVARNLGECPSWHPGAGGKTWIFVDEIEVK